MHLAGAKENVHMSECNNHQAKGERVNGSSHLSIVARMEIVPGIGLWHVHGHQDKYYVQYASTFITGAARIDREIIETLWFPMLEILRSSEGSILPWLKHGWNKIEKHNCIEAQIHQQWTYSMSSCKRITSGITIEELQISLLIDIQRLGKHSTEKQCLKIVRHCTKLQSWIDEFTTTAVNHFGEDFDLDDNIRDLEVEFIDDLEGEGDVFTESDHDSDHVPQCNFFHPEKVVIPLPSNIGIKRCAELGIIHFVGQEVAFRKGQANDTLQEI
ncbi:hypothetical protein BDR06DRAFT_971895 [Suillus hirtellus]|nr:hypothetical protein BDR06DRAFT_971895 [Suillus hirtellus]